jgi:copper chaperone CopZ
MEDIVRKIYLLMMAGAVLFWAFGAVIARDTLDSENRDGSVQRAVFRVENLTCGACFSNINAGLVPLEGFSGMGANLFRKRVAVDFVSPLSVDEIGSAISQKGYPATLESVEPIMEKESFAYLNTRQKGPGTGGGCCSRGNAGAVQGQLPLSAITGGGFCCTQPRGSQLPPVTIN